MSLLSVPLKVVLDYYADVQNETLPAEYAYCDGRTLNASQQDINPGGTYTVPDLRNVFILGADLTKVAGTAGTPANGAANAPGPKGTGGNHSPTIGVTHLPPHNHPVSDPGHSHPLPHPAATSSAGADVNLGPAPSVATESATSSASTGISVGNTGGGTAFPAQPAYHGLVKIMKVKY